MILPGDRSPEQVAFESSVVEFFVGIADLLGVPKSLAAIYGIVFASPRPLSFADITARLDLSNGSISQGLKTLREIGALRESVDGGQKPVDGFQKPVDGGRSTVDSGPTAHRLPPTAHRSSPSGARGTVRYEPDTELRKLVERFLDTRFKPELAAGGGRLAELKLSASKLNGSSKVLQVRIKKLQQWHSRARALLPVARTFLKLG